MVYTRTYYGVPGQSYIIDPLLSFVTILKVAREENVHRKVSSSPGSLQFTYDNANGRIDFDANNPFTGTETGRPSRFEQEKILVKWKV